MRHAEDFANHEERHFTRHFRREVARALRLDARHQRACMCHDARLELLDTTRAEGFVDQTTQDRVIRWIAIEHVLAQLLEKIPWWISKQHAASPRRVDLRRAQDGNHVMVASHRPEPRAAWLGLPR